VTDQAIQSESYDQRLADLLARLGDKLASGNELDMNTVCDSNPEFADELRELWGTLAVTRAAGLHRSTLELLTTAQAIQGLELPYDLAEYLLEEEIGRGGMGIVYRATRKRDSQIVAIKMILKGDFASPAERERFRVESHAAATLDHCNIVPIYEIGEHQGMPFYCMKLIQGQTLAERLADGPLPSRQAAKLICDVSGAIHYAHETGLLHRDLKPSNILIDESGTPFVTDFGLAKQRSGGGSLTKSGAVLGTPSYMSPEQAAGARGQVGVTSDVYSLGAILYHTLTGRPPFLGVTPVDTVLMVIEQDPINPRVLNRRVNRDLESIALRCLQKPKDLRYPTAKALQDDLTAFLNNAPVSATYGRFAQVIGNVFRETHHAGVLENWGVLWMWHSLVLFIACMVTHFMHAHGVRASSYVAFWTIGFGAWAAVFWWLRRRMGPVTFVERQIAHVWAASMCLVAFLFPLELILGLSPLSLAPLLGVVAGMTFVIKAGILSGSFYVYAVILFLCAMFMAIYPDYAMVLFGVTSAACFFFPGMKYYRRKRGNLTTDQM
jgi:serine/threonine-protein kinase